MSAIDTLKMNGALAVLYRLKRRLGKERKDAAGHVWGSEAYCAGRVYACDFALEAIDDEIRKLKGQRE